MAHAFEFASWNVSTPAQPLRLELHPLRECTIQLQAPSAAGLVVGVSHAEAGYLEHRFEQVQEFMIPLYGGPGTYRVVFKDEASGVELRTRCTLDPARPALVGFPTVVATRNLEVEFRGEPTSLSLTLRWRGPEGVFQGRQRLRPGPNSIKVPETAVRLDAEITLRDAPHLLRPLSLAVPVWTWSGSSGRLPTRVDLGQGLTTIRVLAAKKPAMLLMLDAAGAQYVIAAPKGPGATTLQLRAPLFPVGIGPRGGIARRFDRLPVALDPAAFGKQVAVRLGRVLSSRVGTLSWTLTLRSLHSSARLLFRSGDRAALLTHGPEGAIAWGELEWGGREAWPVRGRVANGVLQIEPAGLTEELDEEK